MVFLSPYNSSDTPSRADLAAEEDVCPFCENEVCDDGVACQQAAQEHWADLEYMHMRGK